jgi:hypothetical protein
MLSLGIKAVIIFIIPVEGMGVNVGLCLGHKMSLILGLYIISI